MSEAKQISMLWSSIRSMKKNILDLQIENKNLYDQVNILSEKVENMEDIRYETDDSFYDEEKEREKYLKTESLTEGKKKYFDIDARKYV